MICGRLDNEQKGLDIMLKAWEIVVKEFPTAQLAVLGDGWERLALEMQAQRLGLDKNVDFKGFAENVQDFMAEADAFVLPSGSEGMPNVLLEAIAEGLPCIGTPVGGITDIIESGKNGLRHPLGPLVSKISISIIHAGYSFKQAISTAGFFQYRFYTFAFKCSQAFLQFQYLPNMGFALVRVMVPDIWIEIEKDKHIISNS